MIYIRDDIILLKYDLKLDRLYKRNIRIRKSWRKHQAFELFPVWGIMNNAAMNIVLWWTCSYIIIRNITGSRIAGPWAMLVSH